MNQSDVTISNEAAERIAALLQAEPQGSRLRLRVDGGGCSGFQYHFDFDDSTPGPEDHVFTHQGVEVVIDALSLRFVEGSMLHYVNRLGAAYFEVTNPNSTASCGCGNSFAI